MPVHSGVARGDGVANDVLSTLAEAITSHLDLQRVLQTVTDIGTELSGAQFGAFFYNARDESGRVYQLHVLSGAGLETFAAMPKPRITPLFEPTFTGVATVRIDDVRTDPRVSGMPPGHLPVRSYLAVPVVSRTGEVIGALLFGHCEPARFDDDCEMLLETVAAHAAVAVENARLFAAEQAARHRAEDVTARLELLQTLAGQLSAAMSVQATVDALTNVMMEPLGVARVGVFLRLDDGFAHLPAGAVSDELGPLLTTLHDDLPNPLLDAMRLGRPVRYSSASSIRNDYPLMCEQVEHVPSEFIILPLTSGDQFLGVFTLAWDVERHLDDADVEMLTAASAQVASAVDRARLFDAERDARAELADSIRAATETSRTLQRSLLPRRLPPIEGMRVAVCYEATDIDAEVGGDWYDIVPRDHGAVLVIGDVQGHNLAAAALMGQLRTGLHAYLAEGHSIEHAVARANHLMSQLTDDLIATCCVVEVDLSARRLSMVCAGHPSAICVSADGTPLLLPERTGPPLGVVPDATWPVTNAPLSGANRIVLYTDGLVERRGVDIYAGIAALTALTPDLVDRNTEDAARAIVERLANDAEDDVALLVCDVDPVDNVNETRTFDLGGELTTVGSIRRQARETMSAWGMNALDYTAALIVSELVTNVLRHAGGEGILQLQPLDGGIRILVRDRDGCLPALDLEPDPDATHGRGLMIVKAVADRWGVYLDSVGKTIWAELQLEQANLIPSSETWVAS